MNRFAFHSSLSFGLLLAAAMACSNARAALGGKSDAIQTERLHMKATLLNLQSTNFTIHELQTTTGITIREYANVAGVIFAIHWQGPTKPDLQQLLGNYFAAYRAAARTAGATHRHARIELPTLQVTETAQMRLFAGTAYDPTLMPAGVIPADIQ
jgi:hypothetical protein